MADLRELAKQELEWRKCFDGTPQGCIYFINTYCKMWEKEGGAPIDWQLWECQEEFVRAMLTHRLLIVLKTRQLGLSWTADAVVLWECMGTSNIHDFFRSIGLDEAYQQHERIKFIWDNLPDWMQVKCELGGRNRKKNDRVSQFANGSEIRMMSASKKAGHGSAPRRIAWDETSRDEQAEIAWRAIRPAVAGGGSFVTIISSSDGPANLFADMWLEAINGESDFFPLFFPATAHPLYTPEFLEAERRNWGADEAGYKQAYPLTWQEAFQAASRCPFDADRIAESRAFELPRKRGVMELDKKGIPFFEPKAAGFVYVVKEPEKGHRYTMGVDTAEGLVKGDFTVAVVLDIDNNETVAMLRGKIPPEYTASPIEKLGRWYNNAYIGVETNFSQVVMNDLKESYPYIYLRERFDGLVNKIQMIPGWYTNGKTKDALVRELCRSFHDNEARLIVRFPEILSEMTTFQEDEKGAYGAPKGFHDDTVMALGIANFIKKSAPKSRPKKRPKKPSLGYRTG